MKTQVHIEHISDVVYPQWDERTCYAPSREYPEFASKNSNMMLSHDNQIYDMVRNTLAALDMDREHFGSDCWNPFSEFISKGDTVLIKPNMVCHVNGDPRYGMDCLVTHPAIVRSIIDYAALALNGSGRIILADAPVQSCDFKILIQELHYDKIVDYYLKQGIRVELMDLRKLQGENEGSAQEAADWTDGDDDVEIMLGKDSAFCFKEYKDVAVEKFRVTNYLPEYMEKYHKGDKHAYSVAKAVIDADVIINLPKPKTHRKAGLTASLKNMVGCVARKECLPHHTKGSRMEHGDEYLKRSFFKKCRTELEEKRDRLEAAGRGKPKLFSILGVLLYKTARLMHADAYTEGSWYGNDTIWRTICDICRVVMYADKKGIMTSECQRRMFILADMIVAGEGEGPLCPQPKPLGILVGGWEQIAVDTAISALMGFSAEKVPAIANAGSGINYKLPRSDVKVSSNQSVFHDKNMQEIRKWAEPFIPTSGWSQWLREETL